MALLKLDANGNNLWSKTFGGPGNEQSLQNKSTTDGGDLKGNHGTGDIFIVKLKMSIVL